MALDGVLRTRLLPPRLPPGCLDRPQLADAVERALSGPLVAVVAGAGYGKTTLLAQLLRRSRVPWVWCSCDARLGDPRLLAAHLAAGIRSPFPGFGAGLRLDGPAGEQAAELCDELAATVLDELVVALDDVHLLPAPAGALLEPLVRDLPPNIHLLLAARAPLPFSLARLRAARVLEVGEDLLAFSPEESAELLRSLGMDGDAPRLARLHRRTEGWPAGLILAARSGDADGDTSIARAHFDYLAEEVLLRQPPEVQDFLLDTAVLGRFSPALARAVTGRDDAGEMVRRAVDDHLFAVRLDDAGEWFRYHHLLQRFLRARLEEREPDRLRERHRRAAAWWRAAGEPTEAVRHLLEAGEERAAIDVIEAEAERMALSTEAETLAGWLEALPRTTWSERPAVVLAWLTLATRARHEAAFADAERAIEDILAVGDHERAAIGLVRLQQSMITAGTRPARRAASGERFRDRIDPSARLLPVARAFLATAYGYGCRFAEARAELAGALSLPGAARSPLPRMYADVARAFYVDFWTGRPQDALADLERAIVELEALDVPEAEVLLVFALVLRTYMLLELGRQESVARATDDVLRRATRLGLEAAIRRSSVWVRSTSQAATGRWAELAAEAQAPPVAVDPDAPTSYAYRYRSPAALLAAHRGDRAAVRAQIGAARAEMAAFGRAFDDFWFLCDFATAAHRAGLPGLAREQSRDALAAADHLISPWAAARASLVAALVGEGQGGGDAHLARALALTAEHELQELWSGRERLHAVPLLVRALTAKLGPPGAAADALAACGGAALAEALAAAGEDGPLRARLAELAGRVAEADVGMVDRLLRDREPAVRDAARRSWNLLKARPRATIELVTLGAFRILRDGVAVPPAAFVRQKARALLAGLVAAGGPVHREALCEWLWPELPPERAAAALRSALHDLRRALEPELASGSRMSTLVADGDVIRLALGDRDRCDADELTRLAGEDDVELLASAERLYAGPFLPEWPFEDWAQPRRAALEATFTAVLERLARRLTDAGRPREAVPRYRTLLAREPEREGWHRDLMRAHAAAGERALALRQYHACRTVLRREQGIEPDPRTRALYAALLREEPEALCDGGPVEPRDEANPERRSAVAETKLEQAWNGRSGKSVAEAFTPGGVRVEAAFPGARLEGREAIAAHTQTYIDAVPDCVLEIRSEARDGNGRVTVEWTYRGTHQGDVPGLPARGETVALAGVSVCEMDGELIREERVYWDAATLLAGAGVLG